MSQEPPVDSNLLQENAPCSKCSKCGYVATLLSALIAGAITYGLFQSLYPIFSIPQEVLDRAPPGPLPADIQAELTTAKVFADGQNATLFVGLFGALLAGMMTIGSSLGNKYVSKLLQRTAICVLVGLLVGCAAGCFGHLLTETIRFNRSFSPLVKTLIGQAALLGTLGAGVGYAFGTFAKQYRSPASCAIQGLLGGLLAAFIYPILIAILQPAANTSVFIPKEPGSRLTWIFIAAALLGAMIPSSLAKPKQTERDA